ncbi:MAG: pyridine nucleotide transhydrogenase [Chloroflexota bacterium]
MTEQGDILTNLFIFILASFLGLELIRHVSRLLHTPLMSLTNAISAISIVGSLLLAGGHHEGFAVILGAVAVAASATNIVGGYLITERILRMFRGRSER